MHVIPEGLKGREQRLKDIFRNDLGRASQTCVCVRVIPRRQESKKKVDKLIKNMHGGRAQEGM